MKLRPRDPEWPGALSMNEYLCALPNILPGILNKDLPASALRNSLNEQYQKRLHDLMSLRGGDKHSIDSARPLDAPPNMPLSPSQKSRVTIQMFNSSFNPERPGTVATSQNPRSQRRQAYSSNQAFNLVYQTAELQR